MNQPLQKIRKQLDEVDHALIETLARRQQLIDEVAALKAEVGHPAQDQARESEVLERLRQQAQEQGVPPHLVTELYERILEHSVQRQTHQLHSRQRSDAQPEQVVVAYQGGEGAYSQHAAHQHFGAQSVDLTCHGYSTFEKAVAAVEDGEADCAVLPIENTTAGSINETYDLLGERDLHIVGEEVVRVEHCLLTLEPVPLRLLRRTFSHPQALAQCSEFLASLEDHTAEAFFDTALAAQKVREDGDRTQAAIASRSAARRYGLHVLKTDIANQEENYTRFVVVARQPVTCDGQLPCKTSLVFGTPDEQGALLRCLSVFAEHGINLTKLESRPRRHAPWQYRFYVDLEGHTGEERVQKALKELRGRTLRLKVLGTYPVHTARTERPSLTKVEPRVSGKNVSGDGLPDRKVTCEVPVVETPSTDRPYRLAARSHRPEGTRIRVGEVVIGGEAPVLMAGPCSVESREQTMACAAAVREGGGHILRGGCFKPRTSPYSFQGLGYEGLDLLQEAGRKYGLPIITEVMHPADVPGVAAQADILQIGARNMQNFALLKAVGCADRPVMLKRGMMASIDEWLGAAEYILSHGNSQVMLCERGIRTFEEATRYTLDLSAVPVLRERTHLPIIIDPSHATGERRWVPALTRAALAAGADGVMVEMHPNPPEALSDGPQSLTFDAFRELAEAFPTR